jgi:hypothetical protein
MCRENSSTRSVEPYPSPDEEIPRQDVAPFFRDEIRVLPNRGEEEEVRMMMMMMMMMMTT